MPINPLTPVTDYQSMLNRIFWFTTAAALAAVWILRDQIWALDQMLHEVDFTLEWGEDKLLPVPGGYLLPAVGLGLASRVFRIHGVIASWLGIRERFDIDVIIRELAKRSGVELECVSDEDLVRCRSQIMRRGFYQFVSGRQAQIDDQLVHRALDLWSWFWIGLEAATIFVLTGYVLIAAGFWQFGLTLIVATVGLATVSLPLIRSECRRYGIAQVRAIVSDPARKEQVRRAFDCVAKEPVSVRRAA